MSSTGATNTGATGTSNNSTIMKQANVFWSKQPKANAELFALTYGALVAELVRDIEDANKITEELDRMGHSIGVRCIEEVLAKAGSSDYNVSSSGSSSDSGGSGPSVITRNQNFIESAEIMKVAFRMFLGIIVETTILDAGSQQSYSIKFVDNPLSIFVELPAEYRGGGSGSGGSTIPIVGGGGSNNDDSLSSSNNNNKKLEYSQLLAGMVRGMLEMLQFDCSVRIANSVLMNNSDINEIIVDLKQILQEGAGEDYQEE